MVVTNKRARLAVASVAFFATVYLVWQLVGLRFTNHDDIYYHLQSLTLDSYFDFANLTAFKQARLQAYINMPLVLWVNSLADSPFYDLLNIGVFVLLCASLVWLLSQIDNLLNALIIASTFAFLFGMHYFFTFPQAYPIMGAWTLACVFAAAATAISYAKTKSKRLLAMSTVLFSVSLFGGEYNFLMHPVIVAVAILSAFPAPLKRKRQLLSVSSPYAFCWLLIAAAYLIFSFIARGGGGDATGRVSPKLDIAAWAKTVSILEEKSFVPISIWRGIAFTSATAQGAPSAPPIIDATVLFQMPDRASLILLLIAFFVIFNFLLRVQTISKGSTLYIGLIALSLALIPASVLSASGLYQFIVIRGYLQGHLCSFYSQLGFSIIVLLFLCFAINSTMSPKLRNSFIIVAAAILSFASTATFIYNNLNRQTMMANKQKWDAIVQLATLVKSSRNDLQNRTFLAPSFWTFSGVSAIPTDALGQGLSYWSEYSRGVLGTPLKIVSSSEGLKTPPVMTTYVSKPDGTPAILVSERLSEGALWHNTIAASEPFRGKVISTRTGATQRDFVTDQWKCAEQCLLIFDGTLDFDPSETAIKPENVGVLRLILQFLLPRQHEYAGWSRPRVD